MAFDLSNTLVVGISATALFDMSESDQMFKDGLEADPASVIDKYRRYMQEREDEPLMPGTGYYLVKALLDLNRHRKSADQSPLVEVVVMSRNSRTPASAYSRLFVVTSWQLPARPLPAASRWPITSTPSTLTCF